MDSKDSPEPPSGREPSEPALSRFGQADFHLVERLPSTSYQEHERKMQGSMDGRWIVHSTRRVVACVLK